MRKCMYGNVNENVSVNRSESESEIESGKYQS